MLGPNLDLDMFVQIIQVNMTQDEPAPIEDGRAIKLTYSVKWIETNTSFGRRFDAYLDYPFFEHQVLSFICIKAFATSSEFRFIGLDT